MEFTAKDNERDITLTFSQSFWLGKTGLSLNGKPLTKKNKTTFLLEEEDKEAKEFKIEGNMFKGIRVISSELSSPVEVCKKLTTLELVLFILPCIPAVCFLTGGLIGGALAGLIVILNLYAVRFIQRKWLKILISLEIFALCSIGAYWLIYLTVMVIHNSFGILAAL